MNNTCAVIAGAGGFPVHVATEAKRQGLRVVAIGLEGWVDPALARHVDVYEEVAVGQLGRLIEQLKAHQVRQAVMAGKVTKGALFDSQANFDGETFGILSRVRDFSVNGLLGAIAARLAKEGITLLDSSTFLKSNLCPSGILTKRRPTAVEATDIHVGVGAARQLASLDIGQTVVVKQRVIVAVEALEGTDAAITRAAHLAGAGCVIIKMASSTQDMRFDLPILGLHTISVAASAGAACLAVEAHKTLLLEKDALIAKADAAALCLVGIDPASPS